MRHLRRSKGEGQGEEDRYVGGLAVPMIAVYLPTRSDWKIERAVGTGRDCRSPALESHYLETQKWKRKKSVTDPQLQSEQTECARIDSLLAIQARELVVWSKRECTSEMENEKSRRPSLECSGLIFLMREVGMADPGLR